MTTIKTISLLMLSRIKLQFFASAPVNTTLISSLSDENKTYYDKQLIKNAKPNLVHMQFGQERDIPQNGGKTIEFRRFTPLPPATTPITEGETPEGTELTVTAITAEVHQYGNYILQSDILKMTAIDNTMQEATELLANQGGTTLDIITRNQMQAGTHVAYAPKRGADGAETPVLSRADLNETSTLTVDLVQQVVAELEAANAPKFGQYYAGIIHPYAKYDLMHDKEWVDANNYAQTENMFRGELGRVGGVRFVETSNAKIYKGSDDSAPADLAVFGTLIMGQHAYGYTKITGGGMKTIFKQLGSGGSDDPLDQRASSGWKATHTAKILTEDFIWRVESCSKRFSKTAAAN